MRTSEQEAKQFYDRLLDNSSSRRFMKYLMDGYFAKRLAKRMLAAGEINPDDLVIDVGSGMGGFLIKLAREVSLNNTAIGIDISARMCQYSSQAAHKKHLDISFIEGSALQLDQLAKKATFINASWMIKYLNDEELHLFFGKVFKMLSPKGTFFVSEICEGKNKWANKQISEGLESGGIRSANKIKSMLYIAGFRDIKETTYGLGYFAPMPVGIVSLKAIR